MATVVVAIIGLLCGSMWILIQKHRAAHKYSASNEPKGGVSAETIKQSPNVPPTNQPEPTPTVPRPRVKTPTRTTAPIVVRAESHSVQPVIPENKPADLRVEFFSERGEPRFTIFNEGDEPAVRPKWTIALANYTNEYYPHYRDDPESSEPLPIPTVEEDDFVKSRSYLGNVKY
jgi:hypothetical protein